MTKSDYIKIAAILSDHIKRQTNSLKYSRSGDLDSITIENSETVSKFCEMFKQDNPNFVQERFIQAVYKG